MDGLRVRCALVPTTLARRVPPPSLPPCRLSLSLCTRCSPPSHPTHSAAATAKRALVLPSCTASAFTLVLCCTCTLFFDDDTAATAMTDMAFQDN
ncbi:hypothetical protein OH77DRAFT_153165 [Trametes cingulata]|nr:hypothetical protein OH77DRAFT_153165 [Trametes cingulata]